MWRPAEQLANRRWRSKTRDLVFSFPLSLSRLALDFDRSTCSFLSRATSRHARDAMPGLAVGWSAEHPGIGLAADARDLWWKPPEEVLRVHRCVSLQPDCRLHQKPANIWDGPAHQQIKGPILDSKPFAQGNAMGDEGGQPDATEASDCARFLPATCVLKNSYVRAAIPGRSARADFCGAVFGSLFKRCIQAFWGAASPALICPSSVSWFL